MGFVILVIAMLALAVGLIYLLHRFQMWWFRRDWGGYTRRFDARLYKRGSIPHKYTGRYIDEMNKGRDR